MSSGFNQWWFDVGSGIKPFSNHDMEQHAERIAFYAWDYSSVRAADEITRLRAEVAALKAQRQGADEALRDAHLLIMLLRTHVVEIVDHGDFMLAMGYEPSGHATLHERHIRAFNAARVSVAGEEAQR